MLDAHTSFQIARSGANKFKGENLFVYKLHQLSRFLHVHIAHHFNANLLFLLSTSAIRHVGSTSIDRTSISRLSTSKT